MVRTHQPDEAVFRSILPEDIDWKPFPAFPPSVRLAVLVGQPSEPGPYVIRVKVPSGVKLMPHRHPEDRIYTVMAGVFYIGLGDRFDADKVKAYPPGSVIVLPGNTSHFHWAKSGEYVTQVTAIGPLGLEYLDPVDDPRKAAHRNGGGVMKAARVHRLGPPDVIAIEDIAVPSPGEQEVLVRVRASAVGPWDALVRTGKSGLPHTLPVTLGSEISGIVEMVGGKTSGFAAGDEVFGATNPLFVDGYAEHAVAAQRMIAKKPAALSHIQAAALPVVAVMAWQMLFDHAQVREGQTVVVHGGAGNVGAYAVQFARSRKVFVIATIYGGDADYVRNLGAEHVIDTKTQDFTDFVQRADAVIDTVGGKTQDQLFTLAKPGGIVVSSVVRPNEQLASQYGVRSDFFIVDVNNAQLAEIAGMFEKKQLTIPVGSVLPLSEARAAHEMMAGSRPHLRGKIVLAVDASKYIGGMSPVGTTPT